MSTKKSTKRDALAESAARLFKEGMSYGKIAAQLGLPNKNAAKSKVWAGLDSTPQVAKQEMKVG